MGERNHHRPSSTQFKFRKSGFRLERSSTGVTLDGAVEEYLVHLRAAGRASATLESYSRSLRLLGQALEVAGTRTINSAVLERAVARIARTPGLTGGPPSEATMNRHRSAYRGFFNWAFQTGRLSENPAVLLHLARVDSPPTRPITPQETGYLLATIRQSSDPLRLRDEALFATYALTGVRRSEALRLTAADYDPDKGTLRVKSGKGRRGRTMPVPVELAHLLGRLCFELVSTNAQFEGEFFPGAVPGHALTARQAHARFQHWKTLAGLRPELSIHSFRAGFATTLYRGTRDVVLVSRALGHRDLRQTLRYIEPFPEKLRHAVQRCFAGVMSD